MYAQNKKDLVEIIKKLCEMKNVQLIDGKVCVDHIYMYVAIPPKLSVSEFMSYLKGKNYIPEGLASNPTFEMGVNDFSH